MIASDVRPDVPISSRLCSIVNVSAVRSNSTPSARVHSDLGVEEQAVVVEQHGGGAHHCGSRHISHTVGPSPSIRTSLVTRKPKRA